MIYFMLLNILFFYFEVRMYWKQINLLIALCTFRSTVHMYVHIRMYVELGLRNYTCTL